MIDLGDMRVAGDPAKRDLSESNEPVEQCERGVFGAEGSLGLRSPTEFTVEVLQRVGRPHRFPHRLLEFVEGQQLFTGFLEAPSDGRAQL